MKQCIYTHSTYIAFKLNVNTARVLDFNVIKGEYIHIYTWKKLGKFMRVALH